jgi:outer membrane lipoprotein-sorting protein
LAVLVALSLASAPAARAQAALTPTQILEKMDAVSSGYADQEMKVKLTITDVDGTAKAYDLHVLQKGDSRRLVRFTSGEIKGMASLIEDRNRMYVFLPGFKKVRRIAAHNMSQSFAGSDFSNNDVATASWAKAYDAVLEREDAGAWYLKCTPRAGENIEYAWARVKVDKQTHVQLVVEYYNQADEKVKLFEAFEAKTFPCGHVRPTWVQMSDPRSGHKTRMDVLEWKTDQGLADSAFTVRQLQWGR